MDIIIEKSKKHQLGSLKRLLEQNELPTDDIKNSSISFFVAKVDTKVVGVVGLEAYNDLGLLRSLAVVDEFKNKSVGKKLVDFLLSDCKTKEFKVLYLLTTTADKYFPKFGFVQVGRDQVPKPIKQSEEFKSICPDSAIVMKKQLI